MSTSELNGALRTEMPPMVDQIGGRVFSPGQVGEFVSRTMHEWDSNLLIGEREAKLGLLAAKLMGANVALFGVPGGGKTTLAGDSWRIIAGLSTSDIGEIPPNADLTPQRLVGDEIRSANVVTKKGISEREDKTTAVDAILNTGTKVIYGNEINRTNPYVVNTLLEALENGLINTPQGSLEMKNLLYSVLTMNPSEAHQSTFRIPNALASRLSIGASVGVQDRDSEDAMQDAILNGFKPTPGQIQPVINMQQLLTMRKDYQNVSIPASVRGRAKNLERAMVDTLGDVKGVKISESLGRVTKQHAELSKALAYLDGEVAVTEVQLNQAIRFMTMARLGALSTNAYAQIDGALESIYNNRIR